MCRRFTDECPECGKSSSFVKNCGRKERILKGLSTQGTRNCQGEELNITRQRCQNCQSNTLFERRLEEARRRIRIDGTITRAGMGLPPLELQEPEQPKDLYQDVNYRKDAEGEGWIDELAYYAGEEAAFGDGSYMDNPLIPEPQVYDEFGTYESSEPRLLLDKREGKKRVQPGEHRVRKQSPPRKNYVDNEFYDEHGFLRQPEIPRGNQFYRPTNKIDPQDSEIFETISNRAPRPRVDGRESPSKIVW